MTRRPPCVRCGALNAGGGQPDHFHKCPHYSWCRGAEGYGCTCATPPAASARSLRGLFGPDWTGGLSTDEFVQEQRR